MSKTCLVYRSFTIDTAAFEIAGTGRFTSSLKISAPGSTQTTQTTLVDLRVTHHLFSSSEEAMSMTIAEGRMLVDLLAMDKARGTSDG